MSIRKSLLAAGAALGLMMSASQVSAATGTVQWYFTQDYSGGPVYTFVNLSPGIICYYIGENTAYASIFASSQTACNPVAVNCDSGLRITQVAN